MICGEHVSFFQSKGKENKSEKELDFNMSNTYIQIYIFKTEIVLSMFFSVERGGGDVLEGILPTGLQMMLKTQ